MRTIHRHRPTCRTEETGPVDRVIARLHRRGLRPPDTPAAPRRSRPMARVAVDTRTARKTSGSPRRPQRSSASPSAPFSLCGSRTTPASRRRKVMRTFLNPPTPPSPLLPLRDPPGGHHPTRSRLQRTCSHSRFADIDPPSPTEETGPVDGASSRLHRRGLRPPDTPAAPGRSRPMARVAVDTSTARKTSRSARGPRRSAYAS